VIALELSPDVPVSRLVERALAAEDAGFETAFVSHHYNNRDQFSALATMAAATDDLRLGPGVTNPYETHPVTLASRMATLEEFSDGRGVFGIGPGDAATLRNLGIDRDRPLRRVLEAFRVAQRLWNGETVDHDGTFRAADASLNYDPRPGADAGPTSGTDDGTESPPRAGTDDGTRTPAGPGGDATPETESIPVYVGAQGPDMTRMAAKHADGVLFNGAHPRDYEWARARVDEGLAERPDGRDAFDLAAYASVSIAADADAARSAARYPVAFVVGSAPNPVLDRHGVDRDAAREVGAAVEAGAFSEGAGLVTERMLEAFSIAGTATQVERQVEAVLTEADSFVAAAPLGPDPATAIELLGAVLPTSCE
jgi:5,10-methylenetetrahydromethanopterin reductase